MKAVLNANGNQGKWVELASTVGWAGSREWWDCDKLKRHILPKGGSSDLEVWPCGNAALRLPDRLTFFKNARNLDFFLMYNFPLFKTLGPKKVHP